MRSRSRIEAEKDDRLPDRNSSCVVYSHEKLRVTLTFGQSGEHRNRYHEINCSVSTTTRFQRERETSKK